MSGYPIIIPYDLAGEIVVKEIDNAIMQLNHDIEALESLDVSSLHAYQQQDLADHRRFVEAMKVVRFYYTVG